MSSPAVPPGPSRSPSIASPSAKLPLAPRWGQPSFHAALASAHKQLPAGLSLSHVPVPALSPSPGNRDSGTGREVREGRGIESTLDPMERHAAQLAPPPGFVVAPAPVVAAPTTEATGTPLRAASLEALLPALVRRIAWSAEGRDRGTVRMEIGAGELAGAVLLVQADAGEVKIHVSVPGGADRDAWREKLLRRLDARGVRVTSLEVE